MRSEKAAKRVKIEETNPNRTGIADMDKVCGDLQWSVVIPPRTSATDDALKA